MRCQKGVDLVSENGESLFRALSIERLILTRAENVWEEVGNDSTQDEICVRHCKIAALPVAHRAWRRAGRLGSNDEESVSKVES